MLWLASAKPIFYMFSLSLLQNILPTVGNYFKTFYIHNSYEQISFTAQISSYGVDECLFFQALMILNMAQYQIINVTFCHLISIRRLVMSRPTAIVERSTFIYPTDFFVYIFRLNYPETKDTDAQGKTCHGTLFSTSMSLMHKQIIYWFSFIDTSRLSGLLVSFHIFCEDILH